MKLPPFIEKLERKHWLIVVGVATLLVTGVFAYLTMGSLRRLGVDPEVPAIIRSSGDASSLFAQIADKEQAIAKEQQVAAKYKEREALLTSMKADIESARKRLPSEVKKGEVRQLIEDLARQVGTATGALTVKTVSIRESAATAARGASQDYRTVEYQIAVSADLDGLIQFINLIERNEQFMTVEGIQLTAGAVAVDRTGGKIEAKPHNVQLRIITYIDATALAGAGRRK